MPARHIRTTLLLGSSAALALGLSACKVDNRPLMAQGTPAPLAAAPADYAYAPDASALPYAQPAQVVPASSAYDGYALAQRAYSHDRVAYRTRPEYGFRYGDVQPWAWEDDSDLMFAEPIDTGYRTYYYEPGEPYPYFVRDPQYGYAYGDNGVLMAIFNAAGALLPPDQLGGYAGTAGRYLARGYDLRQVYRSEPHYSVAEPVWSRQAPVFQRVQQPWIDAVERQPAWREYRTSAPQPRYADLAPRERAPERGPPAWAPAYGARANNAFAHAAPVTAREPDRHAEKDWAKAQRQEAHEAVKAERRDEHAFAKIDRQQAHEAMKVEHREAGHHEGPRQMAQAAPAPAAANWTAGEHGHGGGGNKHDDHGPAAAPQGGGDHGDHGKGNGDHGGGGGHGHGKH